MAKVWTMGKSAQVSADILPRIGMVESGCGAAREQLESLFPRHSNVSQVGISGETLADPQNAYWLPCSANGGGFLLSIELVDHPKSTIPVTESELEEFSIPISKSSD